VAHCQIINSERPSKIASYSTPSDAGPPAIMLDADQREDDGFTHVAFLRPSVPGNFAAFPPLMCIDYDNQPKE
jgi:hypothetical protein